MAELADQVPRPSFSLLHCRQEGMISSSFPFVLVEYGTEISVPFEKARVAILRRPEEWLPGVAAASHQEETRLLGEVGFEVAHVRVEKKVQIEVLKLERSPSKVVLLIRWEAFHGAKLFPVFEGSLTLTPTAGGASRVLVGGEYQPPGGAMGRAGDRAVLHRVATATTRDFVRRITRVLSSQAESIDDS